MKKTKILEALLAGALAFALFSCSSPSGGDSGSKSGSDKHTDEDQPIKGSLTVAETWEGKDDSGNELTYYISGTYVVENGGALTIKEGAIVKLASSGTIQVKGGGSLIANGVVFTSYKDSRGRKILAAGDSEPKPADWKNIYIGGGHAEFYNCEFSYGGNNANTVSVIKAGNSNATCRVDGCLFKYNYGSREVDYDVYSALRYEDNVIYGEDNRVTNTTFENNVWPLTVPAYFSVSDTLTFGEGDKANEYNMIHINSNTIKDQTVVWGHQTVPYIHPASSNKIDIQSGGTLTIKGGPDAEHPTVVEFDHNGLVISKGGKLNVEENIHFTNSEKSENNTFKGLYCYADFYVARYNDPTKIDHHIGQVWLQSNTAKNIIIDNDQPTGSDYTTGNYIEDHKKIIQLTNPDPSWLVGKE